MKENKTPEEILDSELLKLKPNTFVTIFYQVNREKILEIIKQIQNDSYNQGVLDCIENAEVKEIKGFGYGFEVDKESILKLIKE